MPDSPRPLRLDPLHLIRFARQEVDRNLHPIRRRRTERTVVSWSRSMAREGRGIEIRFVCTGNVCRSPYASARLGSLLVEEPGPGGAAGIRVSSVGLLPLEGRPSPPEARTAAALRGIDLEPHRSLRIPPTGSAGPSPRGAGLLLVAMDGTHLRALRSEPRTRAIPRILLGALDPLPRAPAGIPDPWGKPPLLFETVFARIDRCVEVLRERIREGVREGLGHKPGV